MDTILVWNWLFSGDKEDDGDNLGNNYIFYNLGLPEGRQQHFGAGPKFAKAVTGRYGFFLFDCAAKVEAWIKACQDEGLVLLVGEHITQPKFLDFAEGLISGDGPEMMSDCFQKTMLPTLDFGH